MEPAGCWTMAVKAVATTGAASEVDVEAKDVGVGFGPAKARSATRTDLWSRRLSRHSRGQGFGSSMVCHQPYISVKNLAWTDGIEREPSGEKRKRGRHILTSSPPSSPASAPESAAPGFRLARGHLIPASCTLTTWCSSGDKIKRARREEPDATFSMIAVRNMATSAWGIVKNVRCVLARTVYELSLPLGQELGRVGGHVVVCHACLVIGKYDTAITP